MVTASALAAFPAVGPKMPPSALVSDVAAVALLASGTSLLVPLKLVCPETGAVSPSPLAPWRRWRNANHQKRMMMQPAVALPFETATESLPIAVGELPKLLEVSGKFCRTSKTKGQPEVSPTRSVESEMSCPTLTWMCELPGRRLEVLTLFGDDDERSVATVVVLAEVEVV